MSCDPEYSPRESHDAQIREWADELRDELIIITNEHFAHAISYDPAPLITKLTSYTQRWLSDKPICAVTASPGPAHDVLVNTTINPDIMMAVQMARREVMQYYRDELGVDVNPS